MESRAVLAEVRNENQVNFYYLRDNQVEEEIHPLEDLKDANIKSLYFSEQFEISVQEIIPQEPPYFIKKTDLVEGSLEEKIKRAEEIRIKWLTKKSLDSLENTVSHVQDIQVFWENDRLSACEQIWKQIKDLLGAEEVILFFNSLNEVKTKEGSKQKLHKVKMQGTIRPNPVEDNELCQAMFDNCRKYCASQK